MPAVNSARSPRPELNAMTTEWFADYEKKIAFYAEHGFDIAWTGWAKEEVLVSWLMRDVSLNHELYTEGPALRDPHLRAHPRQPGGVRHLQLRLLRRHPRLALRPAARAGLHRSRPTVGCMMHPLHRNRPFQRGAEVLPVRRQRPGVAATARSCSVRPSTSTTSMPTDSCTR